MHQRGIETSSRNPHSDFQNVPAEGITVGDIFIPGGTKICAPRYSIGRRKCSPLHVQRLVRI